MLQASAKVWVIGAASFTGQHLIPALQQANYNVDTSAVDITDLSQLESTLLKIQPDYIINLAGISFVPDGANASIYAVNTFGPQNILTACLKLPRAPKHIVLASSSNVYGIQAAEKLNEACPVNPISHYGCSKWAMEQIAKTYSDKLNITVTRPFNYTGRGQDIKFLVPKIVDHFKRRAGSIKLGNIDIWRDFSDVRWVAQAYTELLSVPNKVLSFVNLCSGRLTSIRDVIALLEDITGHTLKIEIDPQFARPADIKRQCGNNEYLFERVPGLMPAEPLSAMLKWMLEAA